MTNQTPTQIMEQYKKDLHMLINWHMTTKDEFTRSMVQNVIWRMTVLFEFWNDQVKLRKL